MRLGDDLRLYSNVRTRPLFCYGCQHKHFASARLCLRLLKKKHLLSSTPDLSVQLPRYKGAVLSTVTVWDASSTDQMKSYLCLDRLICKAVTFVCALPIICWHCPCVREGTCWKHSFNYSRNKSVQEREMDEWALDIYR